MIKEDGTILFGTVDNRHYEQSANVFFHCMRKMDYLKEILSNQGIYPRYNKENISYLQLKGCNNIGIPMVCFCDIYFTKLKSHMKKYGGYGIGLEKKPEIEALLTPIMYINESSHLFEDFRTVLQDIYDNINNGKDNYFYDYIIHQLLYTKPLRGIMEINDKQKDMIFHDEKEWRFIPYTTDVNTDFVIFDQDYLTKDNLDIKNKLIRKHEEYKMKFKLSDIKYILIPHESNRDSMIKFIDKKLKIDQSEKYRLISKLITFDELKDDL